jgi:mannosyltransferase
MSTLLTRPAALAVAPGAIRRPRQKLVAPITLGTLAFLVTVAGNWIPSLWNDEVATVTSATRTWGQLFAEVQHVDAVHAVYYSFMHVWFDLVGYSPFTLRLPSAIAIGASAALLVVVVRMIADARLAITSALIFAVIPRVAWAGGEGRSYAISALLAVTITLLLVVALRRDRARWWILYGAATLLASTVFIYLALLVLAHGVSVFALRNRALSPAAALGPRRHPLRHWVIAAATIAIVSLPFARLVMGEGSQVSWIPRISFATIESVALTQWFWKSPGFAVIAWTLIATAIVILLARRRRNILAAVILPAVFIPTAALVIVSAIYDPLYTPRYVTMCTPFVAVAMAVPLGLLRALAAGRCARSDWCIRGAEPH